MVAAFDYCLHGRGGAAPVHRHGHARPGRRRSRRPPASRLGHRLRDRGGRRGAHEGVLRRPGGLGAVAAARVPARPRHRRGATGAPRGDRVHPRRARHHRLGRDERGVRGELPGDHPHRAGLHRRARPGRAVRRAGRPASKRSRPPSAGPGRPRWRRCCAAWRRTDRPQVGHFTDDRRGAGLPGARRHRALAATGHVLPGSLPAHQGAPAGAGPARRRPPRRRRSRGCASCTPRTARSTRPTTSATPNRTRRRCAAPTRRSCSFPASACSPSVPTSRPPGWRRSSTSTPST